MAFETIGSEDKPLSWEEFEKLVLADIQSVKDARASKGIGKMHSDWIYRGQSNSEWQLLTSLERYLQDEFSNTADSYAVKRYYSYLDAIVPAINSILGKSFSRIDYGELKLSQAGPPDYYELMCYARHLGFPSPLLDWSKSHYIAAFFAFRHARREPVAIYAYKEWNGKVRTFWASEPLIDQQGPYVETHLRHFSQQSTYTLCRAGEGEDESNIVFKKHELAINRSPRSHNMKKYILKPDEKEKVLEMLFRMNINDYTLFGDEESLMRMLAYKESRRF